MTYQSNDQTLWPCPRCKTQIPSTSTFCPSCGLQLAGQQAAVPPPQPKKKAGIGSTIVGLIVIGAVLYLVFGRSGTGSPSPARTNAPGGQPTTAGGAAPVAFAAITLSGRGDSVERFTIPAESAAIAVVRHRGSSNFAIKSLAASGATNDLLVNEIGNYAGTVLFDEAAGERSAAFEITADGTWSITIKHPSKARPWNGASQLSGTGDDVVRVSPATAGLTVVQLQHAGESNFAIHSYARPPAGTLW